MKLPSYGGIVVCAHQKFCCLFSCSLLFFSLPLIFTFLADSISHFLTAAMKFSRFSFFGLPYLLIELFYIGMPVVRTDGRADVWSLDYKNFMGAWVTTFSYPWCSAARTSRARELRYNKLFYKKSFQWYGFAGENLHFAFKEDKITMQILHLNKTTVKKINISYITFLRFPPFFTTI